MNDKSGALMVISESELTKYKINSEMLDDAEWLTKAVASCTLNLEKIDEYKKHMRSQSLTNRILNIAFPEKEQYHCKVVPIAVEAESKKKK